MALFCFRSEINQYILFQTSTNQIFVFFHHWHSYNQQIDFQRGGETERKNEMKSQSVEHEKSITRLMII